MRALICHDDGQLRRVESAIAAIEADQPCYRQSKQMLLEALRIERASLLQYTKCQRSRTDVATMPGPRVSDMALPDTRTRLCDKYLREFASVGQ